MGGKSLQANHIASKAIVIQLKVKLTIVISGPQAKTSWVDDVDIFACDVLLQLLGKAMENEAPIILVLF
jgi:hypothetical protein